MPRAALACGSLASLVLGGCYGAARLPFHCESDSECSGVEVCARPLGDELSYGLCLAPCATDADCTTGECLRGAFCSGPGWGGLGAPCREGACERGLLCMRSVVGSFGLGACAPPECSPAPGCVERCVPAYCPPIYTCDPWSGPACPAGSVCGRVSRCIDSIAAADCDLDRVPDCPLGTFCAHVIEADPTSPSVCLTPEEYACTPRCRETERCVAGRCELR